MRHTIEATFEIVTPMFIGDADPQQPPTSIRPPSVKGALRFWWRALNWGRIRKAAKDHPSALQYLHQREVELFGGAANKESDRGQGCFLLSVTQPKLQRLVSDWPLNKGPSGSKYMGYGITESAEDKEHYQPHRHGIPEETQFSIRLAFKPRTEQEDIDEIQEAVRAWGYLGGLGSRSRRGMGSITLLKMNEADCLMTQENYEQWINKLIARFSNQHDKPPFTAFSGFSTRRFVGTDRKAREVLNQVGLEYKEYRAQKGLRGHTKIAFGLPLKDVSKDQDRRASPLLFHVHKLRGGLFEGVWLYFPTDVFHPEWPQPNWQPVQRFMQEGDAPCPTTSI